MANNTAGQLKQIWIALAEVRTKSTSVTGKLRELATQDIEKVWNGLLAMALHGEYASERLEASKFLVNLGVALETLTSDGLDGEEHTKRKLALATMTPEELRAVHVLQIGARRRAEQG